MRWILLMGLFCLTWSPVFPQQVSFSLPLNAVCLNSPYGFRLHPITGVSAFHYGVDLKAWSEPVYAILDGTVEKARFDEALGNFLIIDHAGVQSIYGHLLTILVREGGPVKAGMLIGITGSTGKVTGEHLHFAILFAGRYIHPLRFLLGLQQGKANTNL